MTFNSYSAITTKWPKIFLTNIMKIYKHNSILLGTFAKAVFAEANAHVKSTEMRKVIYMIKVTLPLSRKLKVKNKKLLSILRR